MKGKTELVEQVRRRETSLDGRVSGLTPRAAFSMASSRETGPHRDCSPCACKSEKKCLILGRILCCEARGSVSPPQHTHLRDITAEKIQFQPGMARGIPVCAQRTVPAKTNTFVFPSALRQAGALGGLCKSARSLWASFQSHRKGFSFVFENRL